MIGSGIPRCLIIGRSLLITSVLCIAYSVLCRIIHPKIETVNELYLLALGLIFISFSMAASIIVSIGLLGNGFNLRSQKESYRSAPYKDHKRSKNTFIFRQKVVDKRKIFMINFKQRKAKR